MPVASRASLRFLLLRYAGVRTTKPVGSQKKKHHPSGWCFLFGMSRAGLNSLSRPARSALNQEVRQGSCEWLCHSWDAGSESSLVARFKKERHPHGCLSFLKQHFCYAKVVACGRVIEREWGNPSKVPPSHSPFLAVSGKTRCLDRRGARYIRQTETDGGQRAAVRWFLTGVRPTLPYHAAVCNAREKCGFATISP